MQRKKAGKSTSSPSAAGSPIRSPAKTPIAVPPTQHGYDGRVAPSMNQGSKCPPPRLAAAQEKSIIAWPVAARRHALPPSEGASAIPIGT